MQSAVPDVLGAGVRLVFVGINPGLRSAQAGHHFANPRNDFWRLLHDSGLTPRLLDPSEEQELVSCGIAITNAALRVTRGSGELRRTDFAGASERLAGIESEHHPAGFAFVGKQAYAGALGRRSPDHGLQRQRIGGAWLYVLPSTSPANAAVAYVDRLRWFTRLARRLA